jgi:hypothetical protein
MFNNNTQSQTLELENSYLINIFNKYAPKDNFQIHKLKKDTIFGLIQFVNAFNKSFSNNIFDNMSNDKMHDVFSSTFVPENILDTTLHSDKFIVFDIEFLEEYDMPFMKDDLFTIDNTLLSYESILVDSLTEDLDIFQKIFTKYNNTEYSQVHVYSSSDNCSFLYFFINIEKLSFNVNLEDFLDGIKIGSEFEGGFTKIYTFNQKHNNFI